MVRLRVLGAHQWESSKTRCATLLLDDVLAIDAGSLAAALSLEEQSRLRAVLLTHFHYDHVKDLPAVGFNVGGLGAGPLTVVAAPVVQEALVTHFLNGTIWPRLTSFPSTERPALVFVSAEPGQWIEVDGYRVRPHPSVHKVPTLGYEVESRTGRRLYYTSDTGAGWVHAIPADLRPDLLVTEVTFSDERATVGAESRHQTPAVLRRELSVLGQRLGSLPPVLVVHISPPDRLAIIDEVAAVARDLDATIYVGLEDQRLSV